MWQKPLKKTIFTLRVDNYAPEICDVTYPLLKHYAAKIGADFYTIKDRKFPDFPPVYEKLQIYDLAKEMHNDWNIYIDSDTLIHPDFFDVTNHLTKDTVAHNGVDMASIRWTYDRFFWRDGRNIGSCNWFAIASDWCVELWHPLDDLTLEEAQKNIHATVQELKTVVNGPHLIDDYTLSRNIAKYGLKYTTIIDIQKRVGLGENPGFLWHQYTIPNDEKVVRMHEVLRGWGVE
jgi:hypothetical protein